MQLIEAARDRAGCERYLPLFIGRAARGADTLAQRRREKRLATAENKDRLVELEAGEAVPAAFESWFAHLVWLDQISGGVTFGADDLAPEEAMGLALLRRTREKFWSEHSSCPACGGLNTRGATFCGGCGKTFGG